MIYCNDENIPKMLKEYVYDLYMNYNTIDEISTYLGINYQVVIHILYSMKIEVAPYFFNIKDDKALVISDTHIGSIYENIEYLKKVYKYAKENNIKIILHAGDLMQGTIKGIRKDCSNTLYQLERLLYIYPYDNNIKNYILLGNHDLSILAKNDEYMDILKSREDFRITGFKKSYLSINNKLISLSHKIDKYKLIIPQTKPDLQLAGHSHKLKISNNLIHIPTLSDDLMIHNIKDNKPGFLQIEINNKINIYSVIDNKKTLIKKID